MLPIQFRPGNIEVQAVLGDFGNIPKRQRRRDLAQRLRARRTRLECLNSRARNRDERSRRLEAILAAGVLRIRYSKEVHDAMLLEPDVFDAGGGNRDVGSACQADQRTGQEGQSCFAHLGQPCLKMI
jgi:hypothetical protein